jgi:hypothetical protein
MSWARAGARAATLKASVARVVWRWFMVSFWVFVEKNGL